MGDVYSRAQCVQLWPGKLDDFATFCHVHGNEADVITLTTPETARDSVYVIKDEVWSIIVGNKYRGRAGIIQDLFLAPRLLIILQYKTISFA